MSDDLRGEAVRGAQAQQLLDNDLLKDAFDSLEKDYIDAWRSTNALDTQPRERLWQALQIVGKVRTHLQYAASSGRLAQKQIDDLARLGEPRNITGL